MRAAEWVQIVFIALLALAAWLPPLQRGRRIRVTLLAVVAMLAIVAARFSEHWISPLTSSVLRDWLPAVLMLVPYWQVGQFFVGSDPAMEIRLTNFDRMFFRRLGIHPAETPISSGLATYLQRLRTDDIGDSKHRQHHSIFGQVNCRLTTICNVQYGTFQGLLNSYPKCLKQCRSTHI